MAQMFEPRNMASIAREIAMDILPLAEILGNHKLDNADFDVLAQNHNFQKMVEDMTRQWNSADNTKARVRVKAATAIEVALDQLGVELSDRSIPLTQRVAALTAMAKLGDLEAKADQMVIAPGDKVSIHINIGAPAPVTVTEAKMITIDAQTIEVGDGRDDDA